MTSCTPNSLLDGALPAVVGFFLRGLTADNTVRFKAWRVVNVSQATPRAFLYLQVIVPHYTVSQSSPVSLFLPPLQLALGLYLASLDG
jgi:hypothetical protein